MDHSINSGLQKDIDDDPDREQKKGESVDSLIGVGGK
jgi:hypothetical protein